ncbi:cupin domain-containing protein [Paucibacter sp. AS339]|uniref:cupin domain-containing protein n=1 Tax=Paucibacter hankyongi TaxID=3133434 RepID=UPI0030A56EF5
MQTNPVSLLKAADIAVLPQLSKIHALNPQAMRDSRSLSDLTGLKALGIQLVTLQPGRQAWEYHRHLYEEQCFYILAGQGHADIDGVLHALGPGDFLGFAAQGAAHTLINTGTEPLVFIAARTQLELDVCDYPRLGKRLYMNGDEEALVDLAAVSQPGVL